MGVAALWFSLSTLETGTRKEGILALRGVGSSKRAAIQTQTTVRECLAQAAIARKQTWVVSFEFPLNSFFLKKKNANPESRLNQHEHLKALNRPHNPKPALDLHSHKLKKAAGCTHANRSDM